MTCKIVKFSHSAATWVLVIVRAESDIRLDQISTKPPTKPLPTWLVDFNTACPQLNLEFWVWHSQLSLFLSVWKSKWGSHQMSLALKQLNFQKMNKNNYINWFKKTKFQNLKNATLEPASKYVKKRPVWCIVSRLCESITSLWVGPNCIYCSFTHSEYSADWPQKEVLLRPFYL